MRDRLSPYCRFTLLRVWRTDRSGIVAGCLLAAAAITSAGAAFSEYRSVPRYDAPLAESRETAVGTGTAITHFSGGVPELGTFRSHELLDALNGAASTLALPVNDMVFRFDDNPMRPYLRYTATVKVFGGYLAVRKFVDAVRQTLPQTSLDAMVCARAEIRSAHVSCELALSAFYRRDPHA